MNDTIKLLKYLKTLPEHKHHNVDDYLKSKLTFKDNQGKHDFLYGIEQLDYIHMEESNIHGVIKCSYKITQKGIDYLQKFDSENNTSKGATLTKWGYVILPIIAIIVSSIWSYISYNYNVELKSKDIQIETSKNSSYKKDSVIAKQNQKLNLQTKELDSLKMHYEKQK